jgi:hypothetical protein
MFSGTFVGIPLAAKTCLPRLLDRWNGPPVVVARRKIETDGSYWTEQSLCKIDRSLPDDLDWLPSSAEVKPEGQ